MYLSKTEQSQITEAIKQAELQTSGEIKVHIEEHCPYEDPLERAKEIFYFLCLDNTAQENGVLFYVAFKERKYAILGDKGIDKVCGPELWLDEKDLLFEYLNKGELVEGITKAIQRAGIELKKHFPYRSNDVNEISDEISFG